jgi:hypothetical protein
VIQVDHGKYNLQIVFLGNLFVKEKVLLVWSVFALLAKESVQNNAKGIRTPDMR